MKMAIRMRPVAAYLWATDKEKYHRLITEKVLREVEGPPSQLSEEAKELLRIRPDEGPAFRQAFASIEDEWIRQNFGGDAA